MRRLKDRHGFGGCTVAEDRSDPAGCFHAQDREAGFTRVAGVSQAQQLTDGHLATGVAPEKVHRRLDVLLTDLDPSPVDADQRRSLRSELLELVEAEREVADGQLPVVADDRSQALTAGNA